MRFERVNSKEKLLKLLIRYDDSAVRTVSSRVGDLKQYAEKLFLYGENFTAVDGEKEAGFVSFYGNDVSNDMIYLTIIAIEPKFRGRGCGTAVLEYLESFGKRNGRNRIKLEVDKKNDQAVCFYKKNGFKIARDASEESFFMEKEIGKDVLLGKKGAGI